MVREPSPSYRPNRERAQGNPHDRRGDRDRFPDKAEWVAGLGTADVATNKPVTSKTPFLIGSISKSFAALAVLKLQEEGR